MKVHIVRPGEESIGGFERVEISPAFGVDVSQYSDNEILEIFANDLIDSVPSDQIGAVITSLVRKMRLGGRMVIGGTDLRLFCKMVISGSMNEEAANKIIGKSNCMIPTNLVMDTLRECGLKIQASYINGVHYEIEAKRG
jgi:hypothetical protein|tara:strand:- start:189 stop:608 length:420 start_codon:yes stop_codon:yes gene_type:complete